MIPKAIRNAMTIDVEDYVHVCASTSHIAPEAWDRLPCRVERNVGYCYGSWIDPNRHDHYGMPRARRR